MGGGYIYDLISQHFSSLIDGEETTFQVPQKSRGIFPSLVVSIRGKREKYFSRVPCWYRGFSITLSFACFRDAQGSILRSRVPIKINDFHAQAASGEGKGGYLNLTSKEVPIGAGGGVKERGGMGGEAR